MRFKDGYVLGMVAGAALTGYFAYHECDWDQVKLECRKWLHKANHELAFGTFEDPEFRIVADAPGVVVPTYRSFAVPLYEYFADTVVSALDVAKPSLEGLLVDFSELETYFSASDGFDSDFFKVLDVGFKCTRIRFFISDVRRAVDNDDEVEFLLRSDHCCLSRDEYDALFDDVARAFRIMTGKGVPVTMRIDRLYGCDGQYTVGDHAAVADFGDYAHTFYVLMHELGHACCQVNEFRGYDRKADIMEEACAYVFSVAGVCEIDDEDRRMECLKYLLVDFKLDIDRFFAGEDDIHHEAAAIADAVITHFGNAHEAYGYLSSTRYDALSPELIGIIDANRSAYDRFHSSLSELDDVYRRACDLSNRKHALCDMYFNR